MIMKTFKIKPSTKLTALLTVFTLLFSNSLTLPTKVHAAEEEMSVTAQNTTKVVIDMKNVVRSAPMIVLYRRLWLML